MCGVTPNGRVRCVPQTLIAYAAPEDVRVQPDHPGPLGVGLADACAIDTADFVHCWGDRRALAETEGLRATRIAISYWQVCAITEGAGDLTCWEELEGLHPAWNGESPPAGRFRELCLGINFGCAIDVAEGVRCWGNSFRHGDLSGAAVALACSDVTVCLLQPDGEVRCADTYDGSVHQVLPAGPFVEIAVGWERGCALRPDDTVVCWSWGVEPEFEF